jgi:hypothetical protein
LPEGSISTDLKRILAQNPGKAARDVDAIHLKNCPRIRRPPGDRISRPWKDPRTISKQKPLDRKIPADCDQAFGIRPPRVRKAQPLIEDGDGHL